MERWRGGVVGVGKVGPADMCRPTCKKKYIKNTPTHKSQCGIMISCFLFDNVY